MIIRDKYRASTSSRLYYPTGKDLPVGSDMREEAYWAFSKQIGDKFGEGGASMQEVYRGVAGPLGLTLDDTRVLVKGALGGGYLR